MGAKKNLFVHYASIKLGGKKKKATEEKKKMKSKLGGGFQKATADP